MLAKPGLRIIGTSNFWNDCSKQSFRGISWEGGIINTDFLSWTSLPNIDANILQHGLGLADRRFKMRPTRLPCIIRFEELTCREDLRRGPKRRFNDQLKTTLTQTNIDSETWENVAANQPPWRTDIQGVRRDFRFQLAMKICGVL